jgi:tetratricopeptide (TPR) repeat protein
MIDPRPLRALLAAATIALSCFLASPAALAQASGAATVRPEVGKPLQAAESLYKAKKHREALAKVAEAETVADRTPYENYMIQRTRGSIAAAAGDNETAAKAFEAVVASGRATGAEQLKMIQAVAGLYYNAKDYAKAAQWAARYHKEGGTDPATRTLLVQSYFLMNDCASVSRLVGDPGAENGRKPPEQELQILANCFLKQKDSSGYVTAIEKLVTYYPKKEYWTDLLNRVQKKSGFSDRLALDVFRLKLATGNVSTANDYIEMTQLAIQGGFPSEAKSIVDKGYAANVLGTGKEAERHKRLRDLTMKTLEDYTKGRAQAEKDAQADKSGNGLVTIGYNYVAEGAPQKGLAYMEEGIKKGGLKRPEDSKLLLGVAQLQSGSRSRALQTLKSVQGNDGPADLARLWILLGQRS